MEDLGFAASASVRAVENARVVMLCVRPQDFASMSWTASPEEGQLVVSVMAGVTIERLEQAFGPHARVARAMPNAPAAIGHGVTALAFAGSCTEVDRKLCTEVFEGVGTVCEVSEPSMDAVTAVAGSGPAWFFLLAEAVREEGIALGLEEGVAETLVRATMDGAAALMNTDMLPPADLREKVTTPGGTTEAGLDVMRAGGFVDVVRDGVRAAHARSRSLANG